MQSMWTEPLLSLLLGYLFGAVPFGLLLTRMVGGPDLRTSGSGNIGATNVLRTGGKLLGALTLLLDVGKGAAAVVLARHLFGDFEALAGMGAFLGHLYPIWLRFRGGKGVATLLGVALALQPIFGLVFAAVWIAALAIWRFSSISGMAAALSLPATALALGRYDWIPMLTGFALLVLWKHRANIERLLAKEEPRVGSSGNP